MQVVYDSPKRRQLFSAHDNVSVAICKHVGGLPQCSAKIHKFLLPFNTNARILMSPMSIRIKNVNFFNLSQTQEPLSLQQGMSSCQEHHVSCSGTFLNIVLQPKIPTAAAARRMSVHVTSHRNVVFSLHFQTGASGVRIHCRELHQTTCRHHVFSCFVSKRPCRSQPAPVHRERLLFCHGRLGRCR